MRILTAITFTFSTLAGTPGTVVSSQDGTGAAAQFDAPRGVAVDRAGNVYVADTRNNSVRKISSSGEVVTLAGTPGTEGRGDGTGAAARFNEPFGVAVDDAGTVYVADASNNAIGKSPPPASSRLWPAAALPVPATAPVRRHASTNRAASRLTSTAPSTWPTTTTT